MDLVLIFFQLIIIGIYVFRFSLIDQFPRSFKEFFLRIANDMKNNIGNWWKTIIIPILVIVIAYIIWILYCTNIFQQFHSVPITDPFPVYFITDGILAPVAEEILQCFFLSVVFVLVSRIYNNKWMVSGMCFSALMIISFLFANAHINPTPVNWLLRFFQFMIYGALYYLNGRNLVPAIVAHSAWNLILLNSIKL